MTTSKVTPDLLPCPHGKEARIINIGGRAPFSIYLGPDHACHRDFGWFATRAEAIAAWNTRQSTQPEAPLMVTDERLWLWRNFVDGRPEYWAFDNPFPCHEGGDPMTLGEPCGWALFKRSENGRPDVSDAEVEARVAALTNKETGR